MLGFTSTQESDTMAAFRRRTCCSSRHNRHKCGCWEFRQQMWIQGMNWILTEWGQRRHGDLTIRRQGRRAPWNNVLSSIAWSWHCFHLPGVVQAWRIHYRLLSDESVVGELLPDESAGRDVDRVLYELQWLHLWPITWKFTSETLLQSLQSTQIWPSF
jgi:hypothetical protein